MFHLRLAARQNGRMSIQCNRAFADYFQIGRRFSATWVDRDLVVCPDENGCFVVKEPTSYASTDMAAQLEFKADGFELPGFHVDLAEFRCDGDMLIWTAPPSYELAWPCRSSMAGDVGLDLKRRLDAARRDGFSLVSVMARVPQWARNQLDWTKYQRMISAEWRKEQDRQTV